MDKMKPQEMWPKFKIETLDFSEHARASFCPERGGIITSLVLNDTEILYMDEATFRDSAKNVKGGIPNMTPNAGPVNDPRFPDLPQHGVARRSPHWEMNKGPHDRGFLETLTSDTDTIHSFPFKFVLNMRGDFKDDDSFQLTQEIFNAGISEMPVAMGLHPYFKVPHDRKREIVFGGCAPVDSASDAGGNAIELQGKTVEECADVWTNDGTVRLRNTGEPMRITIPELGTLVLQASSEYERIWIWSKPGQDFVCIEPTMRDEGGLVKDPALVKAGDSIAGKLSIRLEK